MDSAKTADHRDGVLVVEEVSDEQAAPRGGPTARTLAEWRTRLEKRGYSLTGPTGKKFDISLEPWAGRDEKTRLVIYVKFIDPRLVGTKDPDGQAPRG